MGWNEVGLLPRERTIRAPHDPMGSYFPSLYAFWGKIYLPLASCDIHVFYPLFPMISLLPSSSSGSTQACGVRSPRSGQR